MKITIDTNKNTVKVNGKDYGFNSFNDGVAIDLMKKFIRANTKLDSYEEDSMWMSYRYCIGRHTIASHMRANDIGSHCYGRMSEEHQSSLLMTSIEKLKGVCNLVADQLGFFLSHL